MATLDSYRQYIQDLMMERAGNVWDKRIIPETIFDRENDRYQLVYVGWQDERRIYGVVLHVDIIDEKDNTVSMEKLARIVSKRQEKLLAEAHSKEQQE